MSRLSCSDRTSIPPACLLTIVVLTASCGDLQDPAQAPSHGVTVISPQEAGFTNHFEIKPNAMAEQNVQTASGAVPISGISETEPFPSSVPPPSLIRTLTLSWDPSQDALGYKVYLVRISTMFQRVVDTGSTTQLQVHLLVGEKYVFTVSAYNAAGESLPANVVFFAVS